jgi:multifunctional methyltransferase subunit TRM112
MKVLTLNFLSCAVKACKSSSASFPLHPKDCEVEAAELEPNPKLLFNILPRIEWNALVVTASEVSLFSKSNPAPALHHFYRSLFQHMSFHSTR